MTDDTPATDSGERPSCHPGETRIPLRCHLIPPGLVQTCPVDGTVTPDGYVDLGWKGDPALQLTDDLPAGTTVTVASTGDGFVAKTQPYVQHEQALDEYRQYKQRRQRERERIHQRARRERARQQFWAQYDIPIPVTTGVNQRVSELRRGSTGTGETSNTVIHCAPLDDFTDGRLERSAHEFLCQTDGTHKHLRFRQANEAKGPGPDKRRITCQQCLSLMERWNDT